MRRKTLSIVVLVCLLCLILLLDAACGEDSNSTPTPTPTTVTPDATPTANNQPLVTWQKTFGSTEQEEAVALLKDRDSGYVIFGNRDIAKDRYDAPITYLVKTDEEGNELWNKTFGNSEDDIRAASSAVEASNDGYIVAGDIISQGHIYAYLMKVDSSGTELWGKSLGDPGSGVTAVSRTNDGGYIVAGHIYTKKDNDNIYLIKTDSEGNEEWSRTFGGVDEDLAYSVCQTSDEGYIVAGYTYLYDSNSSRDAYLIKTDSEGNELWSRTFEGLGHSSIRSIRQTPDGGFILTGIAYTTTFVSRGGSADIPLIKIDSEGNELWRRILGGPGYDVGCDLLLASDGGYIIAGSTDSYGAGSMDFYLIKTDAEGNCEPMPSSTPI